MWNYMQARIKKDLPFAKVCGLRRFGIRHLWEQFKLQKAMTAARNNDQNPNTQLLFHASPDPSLITGTGYGENGNGFDPRCGTRGSYGTGAYFACTLQSMLFIQWKSIPKYKIQMVPIIFLLLRLLLVT